MTTGRDALLEAFEGLFDAAAAKLKVEVTDEQRRDAKAEFSDRFGAVLELTNRLQVPALPSEVRDEMIAEIAQISPIEMAGVVASIPLARRAQEMLRTAALQHAQQKMLEHLAMQAESRYGGN
jgi:hypothetical protein